MTAIGVVGASARAAVHSLARVGLSAWAVDLFGDRDLARVAPCAVCSFDDYPDALPRLAAQFPPGPVLYTGGLENHPRVVAQLAATRKLWGNTPDVLERVRDPFQLFPALAAAGFTVPRLVPQGEPCPADGRWLRKPLRSAAGLGIRFATPGEPPSANHYFQEFIDGTPMSAVYGGGGIYPGVTEQLIGEPWLHARGFAYCGNIGPVEVTLELEGELLNLYRVLVGNLGLRGIVNLDFILRDGHAIPLEVNPRYSASVEVLEHAKRGCIYGLAPKPPRRDAGASHAIGKAIYYAPRDITFPATGPWDADLAGAFDPWRLPAFADIPAAGAEIPAGFPVITFFETAPTSAECRERLQSRARELDQLLAEKDP